MFKLLLILKYLRRKLAPLFAGAAVMLCTAMVIIVMSVMGGFLTNFREAARNLTGDIVVRGPLQGFEGYDDLIAKLRGLPEVADATPLIETFGLINFGGDAFPVKVQGVHFAEFENVVGYHHTLMWDPKDIVDRIGPPDNDVGTAYTRQLLRDHPVDPRFLPGNASSDLPNPQDAQGKTSGNGGGGGLPEAIIGIEVSPFQQRDEDGHYSIDRSWAGSSAALSVVPLTEGGTMGTLDPKRQELLVVNEFKSGLYDIDSQYVFVPFETLQKLLNMDRRTGYTGVDPETGKGGTPEVIPARTNQLVVKAAPGVTVDVARAAVQKAIVEFYQDDPYLIAPRAYTWEEVHGALLGAVENEKGLVTFLFAIIGLVAVVMVATTFYMIVLEKTRDIGVLRALGASRTGIINLFLGYGLAIGVVGSLLGLALAVAIVTHLNGIQNVIADATGWRMWNPQTYFFDRIPDTVNYFEAPRIVVGAILSSVIGAALPAWLAGRLRPVDALRYE